jgi:hypothetical protein
VRTVTCANPGCRRPAAFRDDVEAGQVYSCPGCGQALPPVPPRPPEPSAPAWLRRLFSPKVSWPACLTLTLVIAIIHVIQFENAPTAIQQAAASASAAAWTVTVYVLARATEKIHSQAGTQDQTFGKSKV